MTSRDPPYDPRQSRIRQMGRPASGVLKPEWPGAPLGLDIKARIAQIDTRALERYRLGRLRAELVAADVAGALLADPMNIRYATGTRNMAVWTMHAPGRYAFVATDGPVVLFEFGATKHVSAGSSVVDATRNLDFLDLFPRRLARRREGRALGEGSGRSRHPPRRQEPSPRGRPLRALGRGAPCARGHRDRRRPGPDREGPYRQIHRGDRLLRLRDGRVRHRASRACARASSLASPRTSFGPSCTTPTSPMTGNGSNAGCSPPANAPIPGSRKRQPDHRAGDIVGFDSDMVGPFGYLADVSRTLVCPGRKPTPEQRQALRLAQEQVLSNIELIRPGSPSASSARNAGPCRRHSCPTAT